jgi:hypothetical protein
MAELGSDHRNGYAPRYRDAGVAVPEVLRAVVGDPAFLEARAIAERMAAVSRPGGQIDVAADRGSISRSMRVCLEDILRVEMSPGGCSRYRRRQLAPASRRCTR